MLSITRFRSNVLQTCEKSRITSNFWKMDVLQKLEKIQPNKPYKGFKQLNIGYHLVESFRIVKNKFFKKGEGSKKSILVELKEEVLFLPQYFLQRLSEDDIRNLNEHIDEGENIYLYFGGTADQSM